MTATQMKKWQDEHPQFERGIPIKCDEETKRIHFEMDVREMANSCLCYDDDFKAGDWYKRYCDELGEERVNELFNEQYDDVAKSIIIENVHRDNEGVWYNSIIWWDDPKFEEAKNMFGIEFKDPEM